MIIIMAGKLDPNTDIAVFTDDELKELIQRLGLEFPRKANRPMLIALLRGSMDSAPVSHANPDVASLCAALSELTRIVRELKSELKTMKDVNVQVRDSDREIQALKDDVQKLRRELHAEEDHQSRLTHVHADPGDTTHLRTTTSSTLPMHFSTFVPVIRRRVFQTNKPWFAATHHRQRQCRDRLFSKAKHLGSLDFAQTCSQPSQLCDSQSQAPLPRKDGQRPAKPPWVVLMVAKSETPLQH